MFYNIQSIWFGGKGRALRRTAATKSLKYKKTFHNDSIKVAENWQKSNQLISILSVIIKSEVINKSMTRSITYFLRMYEEENSDLYLPKLSQSFTRHAITFSRVLICVIDLHLIALVDDQPCIM